jgi:hypothetical protein
VLRRAGYAPQQFGSLLMSLVSPKIAPAELIAPATKLLALKSASTHGSRVMSARGAKRPFVDI